VPALLAALAAASSASAHGDPASHYLETDPLYPSFANRPSQDVELGLLGLLQEAERRGYPIKVALVDRGDLVEQPGLARKPRRYAEFVTSTLEFSDDLAAPVVIVTPHGIGVGGRERRRNRVRFVGVARGRALTAGVSVPEEADGDALARVATTVVRRIARAGGQPLPADVPPARLVVSSSPAGGSETLARGEEVPARRDATAASTRLAPWLSAAGIAALAALAAGLTLRHRRSAR
jgi:hypothetical protein